ncbi:MAG: hypothetical protein Fur005_42840 [Roseiflexaceae bacterium]
MTRYDDDEDYEEEPPRRSRRETIMEQRLRAARGERPAEPQYDDDDDDDDDYEAPYRRAPRYPIPIPAGGCGQTLFYTVIAMVTLTLVFLLVGQQFMGNLTRGITESVPERVREVIATPTPTVRDRGGTIQQIQALNRLETLRFSVERVIEAGSERGDFLDAIVGEKLLLIASGDIVAGVDLSRLRAGDVDISADGDSITITLPPSEIFSAALNNDRTRVYDRDTRIVTQLFNGEDPSLETQARQAAEDEILRAACEAGVMQRSADEAKRSMEQFLRLLNFEQVIVLVQAGQCVAPAATVTP